MKGLFITFEGIEGSGKSTQAKMLYEKLISLGYEAILTREPGGTEIGKNIRKILLHSENMSDLCELFLFMADRNQHINEVIKPALSKGINVICDRFSDSSSAYQSAGRTIDLRIVKYLNELATDMLEPDFTFILDIPVEKAFARKKKVELDRIEREDIIFHNKVRDFYRNLKGPRYHILNGTLDKEEVNRKILEILKLL